MYMKRGGRTSFFPKIPEIRIRGWDLGKDRFVCKIVFPYPMGNFIIIIIVIIIIIRKLKKKYT